MNNDVHCTESQLAWEDLCASNSSDDDELSANDCTNTAVPVPSTSTGITSNGHLFRVAQSNADSDDDPTPENSPRAIPIPMNGTHHSLNVNNYSGIDDERPNNNRYNNLRRRKANISLNRNQNNYGHYSSHSNSRLSSSCSEDDDASSYDSLLPFFDNKKRKLSETGNVDDQRVVVDDNLSTKAATSSQSWINFTPDSGISAVGSSSTSSSAPPSTSRHDGNNNANGIRNNGENSSMKLFQQKVARVRRNYRNNFGDDSDSD